MLVVFIRLCFALGWDGHSKMSNKLLSRGGHSFFLSLRVIANRPFKNGPSVFALSHYFNPTPQKRKEKSRLTRAVSRYGYIWFIQLSGPLSPFLATKSTNSFCFSLALFANFLQYFVTLCSIAHPFWISPCQRTG